MLNLLNGYSKMIIKIIMTRTKVVAKHRLGLPLISKVKLDGPQRSSVLKRIPRVTNSK